MRYLIYALLLTFIACSSDSESTTDNVDDTAGAGLDQATSANNPNTVENMPWTFLVDGVYHNNATIEAGKSPKDNPNAGNWIDFKANGTFEYGVWGEKLYDGTWFYNDKETLLEITPDDGQTRPSEWVVKHKENSLIWIGTPKFQNNATQMRWLRREGYPSKQ